MPSKTLIIAEKPSVAGDIAKVVSAGHKTEHAYEGDDQIVSWALGHLLELARPEGYGEQFKQWGLKDLPIVPEQFRRVPISHTKMQLVALTKLMARKDVDRLVNACDAGREGELIFREIYRHAGSAKPVSRAWLQALTPKAIRDSLDKLGRAADKDGLADAANCRAESDWLIGINATRALTVRLRSARDRHVWSVGRVQTAALAMVVEREGEILAHEPVPYWLITGVFEDGGPEPHEYVGTWCDPHAADYPDRVLSAQQRDAILGRCRTAKGALAAETRKDRVEPPPPLFHLTELQREANRRHGMPAQRVLDAAQSLYLTRKLITYPRTSSRALPSDYRGEVRMVLEGLAGHPSFGPHAQRLLTSGLANEKRIFNDAEVSDHFAIIPTGAGFPTNLPSGEREVFELIVRRFLAAFHPPAVRTDVERITRVGTDTFHTRKAVVKVPGWRAVWGSEAEEEDVALPILSRGESGDHVVEPRTFQSAQRETKPPARLTEGSLLRLMETAGKDIADGELAEVLQDAGGIGTPATRAEIIERLLEREYIARCQDLMGKRALRATPRGVRLIDVLERIGLPQLTSPTLTAELEAALRDVEHGRRQRAAYMNEAKRSTREIVDKVRAFGFDTLYAGTGPVGVCPVCGASVQETLRTYSCANGGIQRKGGTSCPFVLWKDTRSRHLDRASARQLLSARETPPKAGFFSRGGREYQAVLTLDGSHRIVVKAR